MVLTYRSSGEAIPMAKRNVQEPIETGRL
jgi:hypothetical protein